MVIEAMRSFVHLLSYPFLVLLRRGQLIDALAT